MIYQNVRRTDHEEEKIDLRSHRARNEVEVEDRPLCLVEDLTVRRINDHLTFGQLDTMVSSSSLLATN